MPATSAFEIHLQNDDGAHCRVYRLRGREEIGRVFDFAVDAVVPDQMDPEDLLGSLWTLVMTSNGVVVRRIAGMIAEVEDVFEEGWSVFGSSPIRIRLVPRAWRWSLRESCDVHVDESVSDVLVDRLANLGFTDADYALRFAQTYPKREFIVQYKEADLAFVSRTCENLGISFFFEEKDGRDVVVFTDGNDGFDDGGKVAFTGPSAGSGVHRLGIRSREIPRKFVVRDYNYRTPQLDLLGEATLPVGEATEVIEYGTHFKTTGEGKYMAGLRAQESLASRKEHRGESASGELRAGAFFTIEGTPDGDLAVLVTSVDHEANLDPAGLAAGKHPYVNRFTALAKKTVFRPRRITPKPRVHGFITGTIDAEQTSQYAQLDDQGRYAVRFMFDTGDLGSGHASHRVRMLQPHGGAGYGMHFPLRPGVEVVLSCVDGDPDRPIIAGTVPNPLTQSPVASGNGTHNVIRTGGGNEFNLDDQEGSERIKMTTPHMNTTWQLGAPNAAESGAILNTLGASTTVAQLGIGRISGFSASIQPLSVFTSGGDITTVSEVVTGWKKALAVATALDGLVQGVSGLIQLVLAGRTAQISGYQTDEAKAQDTQSAQQEKANADTASLSAAVTAYSNTTPPPSATDPGLLALQAYQAAAAAYVTASNQLATDTTAFYLAQRQDSASSLQIGDAPTVVGTYQGGYGRGAYKTQGDQDATVYEAAVTVVTDQTALDAALAALDAAQATAAAVTPPLSASTLALMTKSTTDLAATNADALSTLKAAKKADDATYVMQNDPAWVNAQKAAAGLTLADGAFQLFSAVYGVITGIQDIKAKFENVDKWTAFGTTFVTANPRILTSPDLVYTPLTSATCRPLHKLGSDNTLVIDATKNFGAFAPTIAIYAPMAAPLPAALAGEVAAQAILATEDTALAAASKALADETAKLAQVALAATAATAATAVSTAVDGVNDAVKAGANVGAVSGEGVLGIVAGRLASFVSAGDAELVAGNALRVTALGLDAKADRVGVVAENALSLKSTTGAIHVDAADSGIYLAATTIGAKASGNLSLLAESNVNIGASTFTLDTGLPAGTVNISGSAMTLDAGPAGELVLKAGGWQLTLGPTGVAVSKLGGAPGPMLALTPTTARLQAGPGQGMVSLTSTSGTLTNGSNSCYVGSGTAILT